MSSAAALTWFARHEFRLAWREWLAMVTGGRRGRRRRAIIGLIAFAAIMHLPAYAVVGRFAGLQPPLDKSTLIVITATIFLAWALMLSQAIESATRVFYARADLDLIMSSPVALANVFSVRIAAIALSVTGMALLLSTPFVDVLAIGGGIRWFSAYGVVIAIGMSAAAVAIAVTIVLFRLIGPSRTRLAAQILAAIIGAGFVIALQIAAILSYNTLSRFAVLTSDAAAAFAPDVESVVWWPTRAALGDGEALLLLLAGGFVLLGAVMAIFSRGFADIVVRASANAAPHRRASRATAFRARSRQQALRRTAAVAKLCRQFVGHRADHAGYRDGGRPARGRPRMADDLGRRRRRSGGDRTAAGLAGDPGQNRGGADRDWRDFCAAGRGAAVCLAASGGGHRRWRHRRLRIGDRDPALVSGAGTAQPVSPPPDLVAAGNLRGSVFVDRMGGDRGAGVGCPACRACHGADDRRHPRGNLEDQPKARLIAGSRDAKARLSDK
jgi:hypothetical protein